MRRRLLRAAAVLAIAVGAGAIFIALTGAAQAAPCTVAKTKTAKGDIPARYFDLYRKAGRDYKLQWYYLAAVGKIESVHGRNMGPSSAGARGPMQFMPGTWKGWATDGDKDGKKEIMDPDDAIPGAARKLKKGGAPKDWHTALWYYNHSEKYIKAVTAQAKKYANQFGTSNGTCAKPRATSKPASTKPTTSKPSTQVPPAAPGEAPPEPPQPGDSAAPTSSSPDSQDGGNQAMPVAGPKPKVTVTVTVPAPQPAPFPAPVQDNPPEPEPESSSSSAPPTADSPTEQPQASAPNTSTEPSDTPADDPAPNAESSSADPSTAQPGAESGAPPDEESPSTPPSHTTAGESQPSAAGGGDPGVPHEPSTSAESPGTSQSPDPQAGAAAKPRRTPAKTAKAATEEPKAMSLASLGRSPTTVGLLILGVFLVAGGATAFRVLYLARTRSDQDE